MYHHMQQGNRSSSSACGSADVLEKLGVDIDLEPEVSALLFFVLFLLIIYVHIFFCRE